MKITPKKKSLIKKALYWGVILFFLVFVSTRAADISDVIDVLKSGNLRWLVMGIILQVIALLLYALLLKKSLNVTGHLLRYRTVLDGFLASNFFTVATPLGGVGSFAYSAKIFSQDEVDSLGGTSVGMALTTFVFNFAFMFLLVPTIYYLDGVNSYLFTITILAGSALLIITLIFLASILFANKNPIALKKVFFKIKAFYQKIGRVSESSMFSMKDDLLEKNLHDFIISSKIMRSKESRGDLFKVFVLGFLSNLWKLLVLAAVFRAFNIEISIVGLVATHALFYLFTVISPTPQGIGIVEGLVQIVLISLGVPGESSFVITIVYRAISVWFPILIGFFVFRRISSPK